jgi:transcriptional regulator with XRE-family HTH domain
MKSEGNDQEQPRSLAERLNSLFAMTRRADAHGRQREYSTAEVAKAVTTDPSHSTTLSRSYLAMLRNGSHTNPTLSVLEGLAKFFDDHRPPGTPPITVQWLVAQEDPEDELLRQRLADHQVRTIAMRAGAMTPAMRKQLLKMIAILDQDGATDSSPGE